MTDLEIMLRFPIGTRVRCIKYPYDNVIGKTGKVTSSGDGIVMVKYDDGDKLHMFPSEIEPV